MKTSRYQYWRFVVAIDVAIVLLCLWPAVLLAEGQASLSLPAVVQQVLTQHPLPQAAEAHVEASRGLTRQAGAYPNPTFAFEHNDPSREQTYLFKQPLEWPFKRTYRIGVAAANAHIAEREQEGVHQDLIAAAREGFFRVLVAEKFQRIAQTFVATIVQLHASVAQRFAAGDVPEFEVTKAEVELVRATTDRKKIDGQLVTARASLNLLLGNSETTPLMLDGSLAVRPTVPAFEELVARADKQNPQLRVQQRVVEREQLNLKLAWASLVPDPEIDLAKRDNLSSGISGPIVGLSFSVPLWDHKEGAIAAARHTVEEAEARLRTTRLQLRQALLTAYRIWQTATEQVDAYTTGVLTQAEEAATLAERSYREGEGDLLGVLDAQRSLLIVRRDYTQALFDQDLAWVAIEHAAGIATE